MKDKQIYFRKSVGNYSTEDGYNDDIHYRLSNVDSSSIRTIQELERVVELDDHLVHRTLTTCLILSLTGWVLDLAICRAVVKVLFRPLGFSKC
ncbi:hypothetical protein TNIN_291461 [Trichonephila inaurata madagascariensis]|uniref:Uncharacterized protein n=1 Tax=Trichonephila inaurata madagascariensis TaxID=2747483 RepID=A0A8X6YKC9_9ARAC|nr:hypothetical protein TNIN_291461 [Trichonephila inaurata madagascariensis]